MNDLHTDLIFSIFLMCSTTRDVANLMILNRHWLSVSQYEALWRARFSYFLNDRIQFEIDNKKQTPLKKTKARIKKLMDLNKSHVEQSEKLYHRETVCKLEGCQSLDYSTGYRFYNIYKKEFLGYLLHKSVDTLNEMMTATINPHNGLSFLNARVVPMIEKWNNFIEFVDSKLKPDCPDELYRDQRYLLQRGSSHKFVEFFGGDYLSIRTIMKTLFKSSSVESMKQFSEINSQLVEPIRILTDGKRFKYPLNGYTCLELAVKTMNVELVKGILNFLIEDSQKADCEKQIVEPFTNREEIYSFGSRVIGLLMERSYPIEEIMNFLTFFTQVFPSLVKDVKKSTTLSFDCDQDLVAYALIKKLVVADYFQYRVLFSFDILEKSIKDWRFNNDGNLLNLFYNHNYDIIMTYDFYSSFRREAITVENMIYLLELYEKVNGKELITNEIIYLYASIGDLKLVKYFCDVRGFKLPNRLPNRIPLVYNYLNTTFQSGDESIDMLEYLADKIDEDFFDNDAANIIGTSPLNRIINCFIYYQQQANRERWLLVLKKLLRKKPDVHYEVNGVSAIDYINIDAKYEFKDEIIQIFEDYLNDQL